MSQPNRSTRATIKRALSVDDFNIIPHSVSTDQLLGDTFTQRFYYSCCCKFKASASTEATETDEFAFAVPNSA